MSEEARFATRREADVVVLDVGGEIDILNAAELRAALASATTDDVGPLVVMLSGATYFDSQTLEILVDFSKRLQLTRRRMLLVAAPATSARRLLDVSAISTAIPTHDSIEDALASASSGS